MSKEEKVFELAWHFLKVQDIAYFIGMDPHELATIIKLHPENSLSIAYHRGQLKTVIMLRYDALNFAASGSPDALKEMLEHLTEQLTSQDDA